MYNPSLTTHSNNTSGFIATTFDDFAKKKKTRGENRKSYYGYLVRPDGSLLSEKDCLLLDLCIQWTKEGKICTSTYKWLLKNKFPKQRHNRTVSRTFYNISLYINANFKNSQIINGIVEKDKIKIERVADFDQKVIEAITKSEEQNNQNYSSKCQPSATQMSTMDDTNVNPSTYIYKKTIKITTDNQDNQHNQFLNFNFFSGIECVKTENIKVNNYKLGKVIIKGLAKEECQDTSQAKIQKIEPVETPIASDYVLGRVTETETKKRTSITPISIKTVETVGKDGNTYQSPYLRDFRFTERMIQNAISRSNKKHYTPERVWVIIRNILEKKPDTMVYGGKSGAINYLVKAIDGERDYEYATKYPPTKEERAISMAEIQIEKQKAIDERYQMLLRGEVQSLSGAERYYG